MAVPRTISRTRSKLFRSLDFAVVDVSHISAQLGGAHAIRQQQRWRSEGPSYSGDRPLYEGHIPLNTLQKAIMTLGSAVASLNNPARGDMIAALGETTGGPFLPRLRDQMLSTHSGRRVLRDRPAINTETVDMDYLRSLPEGTFGKAYVHWLEWCNVSPDTREQVRFVDDAELAYVMQRYRESHDFYHCLLSMPVSTLGELAVKWFELANFGLPVAGISAVFGPLRLSSEERGILFGQLAPWAVRVGGSAKPLIGVCWEECWERDMEEMKRELGILDPPLKLEYTPRGRKTKLWPSKAMERQAPSTS